MEWWCGGKLEEGQGVFVDWVVEVVHGSTGMTECVRFFFNDTATTEIYTLSLHDALPIFRFCIS